MKKLNNKDSVIIESDGFHEDKYYGYIYITTNLVNGKRYIGQKIINRNWKNYLGSGLLLQKAIKKYGKENFSKVIIDFAHSKEELDKKEIQYIELFDAVNNNDYYNLQNGGNTCSPTKETKEKIRQAHIGLLSGESHPFYGKHHTEESKEKISKGKKGQVSANKGKPMSKEQKEKLKISRQRVSRRWSKPIICVETGKIYNAIADAEREFGYNQGRISRVLCGERETTGGYHWQYYQS